MSSDFNENSPDAMFAKVLQRLDGLQDACDRIEEQTVKTNGRVTSLERDKWYTRGVAAALAVLAGAIWEFFKR